MSGPEPALETPFRTPEETERWTQWVTDQIRPNIRQTFGADYDPVELLRLAGTICRGGALTDQQVLDLAEMFIFWMDHRAPPWTLGAKVYRNYLGVDGQGQPVLLFPSEAITGSARLRQDVCGHWPIIERAVRERVRDTTGAPFPRDRTTGEARPQTLPDERGNPIVVEPAPSPLRAGGSETIYHESSIRVAQEEASELGATFGAIGVISQVKVTSTPAGQGRWDIAITDWRCWGWDDGDFNTEDGPSIQFLPISLDAVFGPEWLRKMLYEMAETAYGVPRGCLERIRSLDQYMRQLAGKSFQRTSVVTGQPVSYFPRPFRIYFSSWDFFAVHTGCGGARQFTVTEIAPP